MEEKIRSGTMKKKII